MLGITAVLTSCSANGKLQQYVENTNINLAGKEIAPGMYCEGFTIVADTLIATYNIPEVSATSLELANWDAIQEKYKELFMQGLESDKATDPDGAKTVLDADVYMKGVFKYENATINVLVSPEELKEVLK